MAGTTLYGQLTAARPAAPSRVFPAVRFACATPADDAAIRRLLRDNPLQGSISLSLEREPDYFYGARIGGSDDETILAFDGDRLVCMGRSSARACWLNGEIKRVGYLGELRLDASAQGRFDLLRQGYRYFHERQRSAPVDFYFTSIASDNYRARQLLERGLPTLPRYEFLTEFVTVVISINHTGGGSAVRSVESASGSEVAAFLNDTGQRAQLAAAWTEEKLRSLANHGLAPEQFHVLRRDGKITACAALWDQRAFRQTVIRGYAPALAALRPFLNLVSYIAPIPHLPPPGATLAHAFVSPLAFASGGESLLPDLIRSLQAITARRGLKYLTLGLPASDPRLPLVRRAFRHRTYSSRLYRVAWPDDPPSPSLDSRPFLPDVALL